MNSKINIKEIWTSRFKRNDMNNDGDFSDFSDKAKTEMKKLDDIVKAINNVECDNCENNGIGGGKLNYHMLSIFIWEKINQ